MPRPAVEHLKARIAERAQATTVPGVLLASQAVKLTGGMFAGQDGTVAPGAAPAGKVRVMLTAYGREVVVSMNLIEAI